MTEHQPTVVPTNAAAACSSDDVTLVPGSLRGYREWRLDPSSPIGLGSMNDHFGVWPATQHTAECKRNAYTPSYFARYLVSGARRPGDMAQTMTHAAPKADCTCGIYAWYRPDLVDGTARYGVGFAGWSGNCPCGCGATSGGGTYVPAEGHVIGAVDASGRIVLGTRGFRAERASVAAVVIPDRHQLLRAVLPSLGVAVFDTLDALIEAYPPSDDLAALGVDVEKVSPPAPAPRDYRSMTAEIRLSQAEFARLITQMGVSSAASVDAIRRMFAVAPPTEVITEAATDEPKKRALELRRRRGTGPAEVRRAPRSIDPRRAR